MRTKLSLMFILAAASQMGATDGCDQTVLRDPGFDLWCGDTLCVWKITRGDAQRVATWHDGDSGVELIGPDAAISQLAPVNSGDGTCIRFDLVANIEDNVEAHLDIDVFGDGTIDRSERMPTSHWKPLSYKVKIKAPYSGVRFELSKRGTGKAVFAQIEAHVTGDCAGITEISGEPAPLGAPCTLDAACASQRCAYVAKPSAWFGVVQVCVGCATGTCTDTNEVCGRGAAISSVLEVPNSCVAAGSHEVGEQCSVNEECSTSSCTASVCSTCKDSCANGETCGPAYVYGPSVCSPGAHRRRTAETCATDGDCASNHCDGAVRMQCADGRVCDSPADCPVEDNLAPGACTAVGIQGGRCQ